MKTAMHFTASSLLGLISATQIFAGAAGPSVGNPNMNEAAEEPDGGGSSASMSASKRMSVSGGGGSRVYALVDTKHILNQYYDGTERLKKSDPSVHGTLQLGARMYSDRLDLSIKAGAVKVPSTQAIYQERPQITADIYPIRGSTFNVLLYNNLQFPVRESDRDPSELRDTDRYERDSLRGIDASVYTIGLAPIIKTETVANGQRIALRLGADAWTKMYSKPLYIDESNQGDGDSLTLVNDPDDQVDKPFEDRALRFVHQESLGLAWTPSFASSANLDLGAHIESRYLPRYFKDDTSEEWQYTYEPERISFWRAKLNIDLNSTFSLQDEVFLYRNGFFAENRYNTERRVRNIIKLSARL
jgi:hypothetical protein